MISFRWPQERFGALLNQLYRSYLRKDLLGDREG